VLLDLVAELNLVIYGVEELLELGKVLVCGI
jgi:hypothetical protein